MVHISRRILLQTVLLFVVLSWFMGAVLLWKLWIYDSLERQDPFRKLAHHPRYPGETIKLTPTPPASISRYTKATLPAKTKAALPVMSPNQSLAATLGQGHRRYDRYVKYIEDCKKKSLAWRGATSGTKKHHISRREWDMWFYHAPLNADIWDTSSGDDRILAQLAFARKLGESGRIGQNESKLLLTAGTNVRKNAFTDCPVSQCRVTVDASAARKADAVIFSSLNELAKLIDRRSRAQILIYYQLESPNNTPRHSGGLNNKVNWTATYRTDSTIVAPYEKFVLYDPDVWQIPKQRNYARGKTKYVAWFVSHCSTSNRRLQYAEELANHIQVDIYGTCGKLKCSRSQSRSCYDMLSRDYYFYLAFENSNCQDYITEKFYWNALKNDVVPIVMGAKPADYYQVAPYHSFIHVDDFENPKELADYLYFLAEHSELYNEYYSWKDTGTFIDTRFWCRLCAMLHSVDERKPSKIISLEEWWRYNKCFSNGKKAIKYTMPPFKSKAKWNKNAERIANFTNSTVQTQST